MKHLYDDKNYKEFLDGTISVSEKIDGSSIIVSINENGKPKFLQREGKAEIDAFVRVKSEIYEDIITFLESKNYSDYVGYEFHFEFFFEGMDTIIPVKTLPKNNAILNVVINNGEVVLDKDTLFEISDYLEVGRPRILFQGKLNDNQKNELYKFVETKTINKQFAQFVKDIFNPSYEIFGANDETEGFVLTNLETQQMLKLVDTSFTDKIKDKKQDKIVNDALPIIRKIIEDFKFDSPTADDFNEGKDYSSRVVNLIIENVVNKWKDIENSLSEEEKEILRNYKMDKAKWYTINNKFINNSSFLTIKYDWVTLLTFTLISYYMKIRKKATKDIPKSFIEVINDTITKFKSVYESKKFRHLSCIMEQYCK